MMTNSFDADMDSFYTFYLAFMFCFSSLDLLEMGLMLSIKFQVFFSLVSHRFVNAVRCKHFSESASLLIGVFFLLW